ncbi:MAG: SelT/SelW/SelH family protein [Gemmatimonadales bacterium]|nr:SelT/SelW/SelH family protein [Gemmatimonadales bacterium]
MAAELRREFPGVEILMTPSSGGVFDVTVDGALVFSKRQAGRHANPGEVVELTRRRGVHPS